MMNSQTESLLLPFIYCLMTLFAGGGGAVGGAINISRTCVVVIVVVVMMTGEKIVSLFSFTFMYPTTLRQGQITLCSPLTLTMSYRTLKGFRSTVTYQKQDQIF